MKIVKFVLPVVAAGFTASSAMAATGGFSVDATNTIPGVVANAISADGEGVDWTGAVLKVDLTSGSLYNNLAFPGDATNAALWGFVPELRWDSAVGIQNDGSAGIAGGAGDLGGGPQNLGGGGVDAASITWFNTNTGNTGPVQIGNISAEDQAQGTWELILSFADSQVRSSGIVENGAFVPEPASLALMGLGGIAALRRRR